MSHFYTLVLVPKDTKNIEKAVSDLLAPYDENKKYPSHPVDCYCIGSVARNLARDKANELCGPIDAFRQSYKEKYPNEEDPFGEESEARWKAHIKPYTDAEKIALDADPDKEKPNPECDDCHGAGRHFTTYNDNSKWDWWVIGGRWTGVLTCGAYEPDKDQENFETCWLCHGTGTRPDGVERFGKEWAERSHGCNGCNGTGKSIRHPGNWKKFAGDIAPVANLVPIPDSSLPFAIVTPDGLWYERGHMGWFGIVTDGKEKDEWHAAARTIIEKHNDAVAVVCDLHI